ncbi:hypothetical protein BH23ACT9_BH23ACT9_25780 [soil metagenome]
MTDQRGQAEQVKDRVEEASDNPWVERVARIGFGARGGLFVAIGVLAASVSLATQEDADATGAINQVGQTPFGTVILIVLAIGLAAYTGLRLMHLVINPSDEDGIKLLFIRISYLVQAGTYGGLTVFIIRRLVGGGGGGGGDEQQATARVLELPMGQWLIGGVAVVLIGVAIAQLSRAITRDFMQNQTESGGRRQLMLWTGIIGHTARAALFGTIAWLFLQAALQSDSSEAGGTDEAIQELAVTPVGTVLLLLIAAGVIAYGLWCLSVARWGDPSEAQ